MKLLQIAKPIFFETDLVQRTLTENKTATRRICKDGNDYVVPDMSFYDADKRTYAVHNYANKEHTEKLSLAERPCPICPGDILYVRETWKVESLKIMALDPEVSLLKDPWNNLPVYTMEIKYKADDFCNTNVRFSKTRFNKFEKFYEKNGWQSPYFMPKEAARLFLKVTDVRVELLQDMKLNDFLSEGVVIRPEVSNDPENAYLQAREVFIDIWNSTIKKQDLDLYGWDANPWVWVIEFERIL